VHHLSHPLGHDLYGEKIIWPNLAIRELIILHGIEDRLRLWITANGVLSIAAEAGEELHCIYVLVDYDTV